MYDLYNLQELNDAYHLENWDGRAILYFKRNVYSMTIRSGDAK